MDNRKTPTGYFWVFKGDFSSCRGAVELQAEMDQRRVRDFVNPLVHSRSNLISITCGEDGMYARSIIGCETLLEADE